MWILGFTQRESMNLKLTQESEALTMTQAAGSQALCGPHFEKRCSESSYHIRCVNRFVSDVPSTPFSYL